MGNGQLGELFIGSAKDALGFGAPNVIADESAFIEDPEFSLVLRMLAGQQTDLAEATKKIEEFSGSVARRASQQTCSRVEAKPERLQGGSRVINRILLMSRPRNQPLPPVPTWVCPHCGHVHRPTSAALTLITCAARAVDRSSGASRIRNEKGEPSRLPPPYVFEHRESR